MIIQVKVVERLRGFHILYGWFFCSLTWQRKKGCFSGSLWRLCTSENVFAHVHPGTGCQQLKGHLVDSGTGLVTLPTQREKWWSLWPSTLTFTFDPCQAVWKEGPLHPGECVCLFPPALKEVKDNCREIVQRELVWPSASFFCRATGSRDWQMAGLQVMCFY